MNYKLSQFLEQLTQQALVGIMWEALSLMQSYNGRSLSYCIVTAMGGEAEEVEGGGYQYKLPTIEEANKHGENCPLI